MYNIICNAWAHMCVLFSYLAFYLRTHRQNFLRVSFSFCLAEQSRADLLHLVIVCLTFLAQRYCLILFSHKTLPMFSVVKALNPLTVGRCGMTLCFPAW